MSTNRPAYKLEITEAGLGAFFTGLNTLTDKILAQMGNQEGIEFDKTIGNLNHDVAVRQLGADQEFRMRVLAMVEAGRITGAEGVAMLASTPEDSL